ncbi:MAG: hypothetical protein PHF86_14055 [Candidatus Nanoarchaeia archaeon]|jgi:hypothetical protein|nr:hypothetical protein [Candidatus Nanoarchaeia archaeon]
MLENIYTTIETDPEVIYDPMSVNFSKFKFTKGYYNHRLTQKEIEKPYLLSFQYFGIIDYENLILLINNISDIFEVPVGTQIKIPKLQDIQFFLLENTK